MSESILAEDSKINNAQLLSETLGKYRGLNGRYDEAVTDDGTVRPGWDLLFAKLRDLSRDEVQRRLIGAQRQIHIDGVAFNPHDSEQGASRPWSLDPVPMVIRRREWSTVEAGLQQRARLSDLILLDLLGPQTLLHERVLPPEVLFSHPRYFPAFHSLVPRPRRHLQLYAADLARSPDGSWWVTGDRTRSPFGLGYVLENRIITSRMLPAAFEHCNVERLAPFFITMQNTLRELAHRFRENPRIAIWSKGPKSRAYFEDAFLARYLGYTLVEGGDLAVRENKVMIKTLGGLLPVEVLLRRVEDHDADPAELIGDSVNGVSGLLEVIRSGQVAVANSIGSSLSESPMLLAFLPAVCRHLLSEELKLPSIATWWCGQPVALNHVLKNFDELVIRYAFRRDDEAPFLPRQMSVDSRADLIAEIKARPEQFVAQANVVRSTAPVWNGNAVEPWSLAIRTYLIAEGENYTALSGGLARVAPQPDVLLHNMTSGEKSQDVWVLADEPVAPVSLLNVTRSTLELARGGAELPSRAADNLFWLGRNLERTEQICRLARVALQHATRQEGAQLALTQLIAACRKAKQLPSLGTSGADAIPAADSRPFSAQLVSGLLDLGNIYSLRNVARTAENSAVKVRDRIAIDYFRIVSEMRSLLDVELSSGEVAATELSGVLDTAIIQLSALSGLANESMTRTLGWRFLDLGRRIERAYQTAAILGQLLPLRPEPDNNRSLEFCLEIHDSYMTYRNRYLANMQLNAVLDLLLTDETNPRSIMFQLQSILEHVDRLPRRETQASLSAEQRAALTLHNTVRLSDITNLADTDRHGELTALHKLLGKLSEQLPRLSDAISARFLIHAGFQRHFAADPNLRSSDEHERR
ncbi:MAG: circularly permuted type 2 ATP-grasp protein [Pirellulaceae bacterium]